MFILDLINRELQSLERLELKFGVNSDFFDKIPVRILLDVLFRVFRFSKASFNALASSFMTFENFVATLTLRRGSQWGGGFYGYRLKFWLFYGYRLIFFSYG